MKYVFFGTPRFAEIVLKELIDAGMPPTALVCNPDRPLGRKKIVTPPPTKTLVAASGLPTVVLQPEALDGFFIQTLRALEPDFFIVAAYAKIIPQAVLDVAHLGTLGTHPSLLPAYRGASPIQSVILAGEERTGASIYLMDDKMDHGPVLAQEAVPLDAQTTGYRALEEQLAALSGRLLVSVIPAFADGTVLAHAQDDAQATFTKKFSTDNGFIKDTELDAALAGESDKAELILRTINALNPEPGAWTIRNGKRIKLLEARMDGAALTLTLVQEEGQRPRAAI